MTRGSTSIGCNNNPLECMLAQGCRFMSLRAFTIPVRYQDITYRPLIAY